MSEPVFSPDGTLMAAGDSYGGIHFWHLAEKVEFGKSLVSGAPQGGAIPNHIYSLAWSPDGKFLAAGDRNSMVRLWDMSGAKSREVGVLPKRERDWGWVLSLSFSPDSRLLAAASADGNELRVWDVVSRKLRYQIRVPAGPFGVAFAPDGKHLATANMNGTVYVLRLPER